MTNGPLPYSTCRRVLSVPRMVVFFWGLALTRRPKNTRALGFGFPETKTKTGVGSKLGLGSSEAESNPWANKNWAGRRIVGIPQQSSEKILGETTLAANLRQRNNRSHFGTDLSQASGQCQPCFASCWVDLFIRFRL